MIWQPTIAQYLAAHAGSKLSVHALAEPHARWNIVALYAPRHAAEAAAFQANIAAPKKAGALDMPHRRFGFRAASSLVQLAVATGAEDAPVIRIAAVAGAGGSSGDVPALYTDAQAKSGASKYSDNCHGDQLQGMSGPALKGTLFASVKTGFSVGDILTFMSINMPATQPGSLAHDDYTDIMAYVLAQNGFPAGATPLGYDDGMKSKVPLIYHGK
jgi:polar amino acid transport system substrate-binding protein